VALGIMAAARDMAGQVYMQVWLYMQAWQENHKWRENLSRDLLDDGRLRPVGALQTTQP
jgi:hypothetical protein